MSEIMWTIIFGSYGFTLLTTKFLYSKTEKLARKEDLDRVEKKLDEIYSHLLGKVPKPGNGGK